MNINNRIQKLIDKLDITAYEFSKRLGNKRPDAIYAILKENSEITPSPKTLEKIRESFPEINYTWLLTGEGDMLKEPSDKIVTVKENACQSQKTNDNTDLLIETQRNLIDLQKKMITKQDDEIKKLKQEVSDIKSCNEKAEERH